MTDDVAAVIVQHPNVFGVLEDVRERSPSRRTRAARRLIQIFDPLSLGVLAPPGRPRRRHRRRRGAVARQPPELRRAVPRASSRRGWPTCGRHAGAHRRRDGRRRRPHRLRAHAPGARAAHPPREGHLEHLHEPDADGARRARSTWRGSGPDGLAELGRQCAAKAAYASDAADGAPRGRAASFPGAPFFKEFAVRLPRPATEVRRRAGRARVPRRGARCRGPATDVLLVAVTERRTREEIDAARRGDRGGARLMRRRGARSGRQGPPAATGTIAERSPSGRRASSFAAAGRARGRRSPRRTGAPTASGPARGGGDRPRPPLHAPVAA